MRENSVAKLCILIGIITVIAVAVLYPWSTVRGKQDNYTDNVPEYNTEAEKTTGESFAAAETYIGDESQADPGDSAVYVNAETSYRAIIEDDAQLLNDEEEQELATLMQEITSYGNVAFKTIDYNDRGTESYARKYYRERFGTASGTLFLIDMDNRNIWIHSDGAVYKVITESYADTITDNVYRYASDGDYYDCAAHTYDQILTLLKGQKIAQPMKYISNGLLAVILALLLNYGLVSFFARIKKPGRREILRSGRNHFNYTQPKAFFVRESRTYNPVSSDSSGSSGSSSGGGGSSSGSSGGGGGHSF
ncbi:MAG: TPM domain-containing protein [Lachnospiraceae bacterium]|nr:TPM domain-containing protein [Lachnospiraceae bacterium]